MKKSFATILAAFLLLAPLTGCIGTPVVIGPTGDGAPDGDGGGAGELRTGLALVADISGSTAATAADEGAAQYDVTAAAVLVDERGVIRAAVVDGVRTSVKFDAAGGLTTDLTAPIPTKNELGADYGMVTYGGARAEWDQQVAALCAFAVGKTVEELKNGAIDANGRAPAGSDLASSATIYLGGCVSAIEAAVANAAPLGAQTGDALALSMVSSPEKSTAATAQQEGDAQLDVTAAAVSHSDGVITSCLFDGVQPKVTFDAAGTLTSDLTAPIRSKNELGADYGMVAYGGARAEWNVQAAAFAAYITGKTAAEVAGIAVSEGKAADADLVSSVTISIGDFQSLIAKALA